MDLQDVKFEIDIDDIKLESLPALDEGVDRKNVKDYQCDELQPFEPVFIKSESDVHIKLEVKDEAMERTPQEMDAKQEPEPYSEHEYPIVTNEETSNETKCHNLPTCGPKTAAQRGKEYRERKKLSQTLKSTEDDFATRQRNAERCKQYRERKKTEQATASKGSPKTAAQRSKEYRERMRLSRSQKLSDDDFAARRRHAERCKEYRERRRNERVKEPPNGGKTAAQRGKEYRERQKIRQLLKSTSASYIAEVPRKVSQTTHDGIHDEIMHHRDESSAVNAPIILKDISQIPGPSGLNVPFKNQTDENVDQNFNQYSQIPVNDEISNVGGHQDLKPMLIELSHENKQRIVYPGYNQHASAHLEFSKTFINNPFGYPCVVCDRLWFKNDLKPTSPGHIDILNNILPNITDLPVDLCSTCKAALDKQKVPALATYNGFAYPTIPPHLPALDVFSQRLISPRIPFMQVRRLRHVHGQNGIYGEIINVPVDVNTMVTKLPRNVGNDHCFYVHIKKKMICTSGYIRGLVNKRTIKEWLTYLTQTPLYIHHNITTDYNFFDDEEDVQDFNIDDISEHVSIEDNLVPQRQTLLWNENDVFVTTPGQNVPITLLFDEHAEELSFPNIYVGQFREYKEDVRVTPFMQASSELRRTDRRGTDPQHLLYLAAKIMSLRVRDSVTVAVKNVGTDANMLEHCVETNLAFLRCIPNSSWYWSDRKKDLYAMMRQRGAPHAFMTLSCNEIGWIDLLKVLHRVKWNTEISDEELSQMSYIKKATLINEDAVICAIYFNKLVNCIMHILQAKKKSPFRRYRVLDYFQRVDFQHRGSPRAHIFLWLDNAPANLLTNDVDVTSMIDELVSVSASDASGNIKLQTHKHTFTCYKKMNPNKERKCRFGAPFMPSKATVTLLPMKDYSEEDFQKCKRRFEVIQDNLENFDYADFNHFYAHNNVESDQHYQKILRAGIDRPTLFYRRLPSEKWHNPFNPFVLHHLKTNMNFQIIQDELSCAAYVVEYINKSDRSVSNLRRIIEIMEANPEFDAVEMARKMNVDLISTFEMSVQEAAWYLLRMPMAKSTVATVYIPTIRPMERQRIRKTMRELEAVDEDGTDIWKENWFDRYEKRPEELEGISLAQFVSKYYKNNKGEYAERKEPKIIRYRNYDMTENLNDYKREMVLLYIPFRNEENDIMAGNKFVELYEANENLILERRKEFESNLDMQKTLQIIEQSGRTNGEEIDESENGVTRRFNFGMKKET